jgi:hypothetical protein
MASGEACLLDSNILLRISKNNDPHHAAISRALHVLVGQGRATLLYVTDGNRVAVSSTTRGIGTITFWN